MSTRGVIARAHGDGYRGRYHHSNSYPTGLGKTLWKLLHDHFGGDVEAMLKVLIDDHPAGWSSINGADFRKQPGFRELGSGPCETCGRDSWVHYYQEWKDHGKTVPTEILQKLRTGLISYQATDHAFTRVEDDSPRCYCHGDRHEEEETLTDENVDHLHIEWVYVFAPRVMTVLYSTEVARLRRGQRGTYIKASNWTDLNGVRTHVPAHYYVHEVAGTYALTGSEPDWKIVECGARLERCHHYKCYHDLPCGEEHEHFSQEERAA